MNPEFITRVVGLVQKTNDRVIIADPQTGKAVVVLGLDSYEKLCNVVAPQDEALAAQPTPQTEIRLPNPQVIQKMAQPSVASVRTKVHVAVRETPKEAIVRQDLTHGEPEAKMNRDIGAWKSAPESRRIEELQSVPQPVPQMEMANVFEEEERFYLEPIE